MDKIIWILWLQGWKNAPWLQKQVAESWEVNNPGWKIEYVSLDNLKQYVTDIDYIYTHKDMSMKTKSNIIRLSLLKNYGGVWADSTVLCMRPLNTWINNASQFWMYRGPASWFIVSEKNGDIVKKWKAKCDEYWCIHDTIHHSSWMDHLFRDLCDTDKSVKESWEQVPCISCQDFGQANTFLDYPIHYNTPDIKKKFETNPPHVLKLSNRWNQNYRDNTSDIYQESNGYFAITMSKRPIKN